MKLKADDFSTIFKHANEAPPYQPQLILPSFLLQPPWSPCLPAQQQEIDLPKPTLSGAHFQPTGSPYFSHYSLPTPTMPNIVTVLPLQEVVGVVLSFKYPLQKDLCALTAWSGYIYPHYVNSLK